MLMIIQLILLPTVAAFVGWITNKLAVHLIFRPYKPVKLPLIPYRFQGLVPKRLAELAAKIGQVVERELFSSEDIISVLRSPKLLDELLLSVRRSAQSMVEEKIPLWVPPSFKEILLKIVDEIIDSQVPVLLNRTIDQMSDEFNKHFDIAALVETKFNEYPIEHVEKIIVSVAAKELKHIEFLGAVLGFVIGLVQFLLLQIL